MPYDATIVAIDGKSGSGKSTIAELVARRLGLPWINSGAYYRAIAWAILFQRVNPEDADACVRVAKDLWLEFVPEAKGVLLSWSAGVSGILRPHALYEDPAVSDIVSAPVAQYPGVRARVNQLVFEQSIAGAVIEGRDIGMIMPASVRIWLTVPLDERLARVTQGRNPEVAAHVERRDTADGVTHMRRHNHAIEVVNQHGQIEATVDEIVELVQSLSPAQR